MKNQRTLKKTLAWISLTALLLSGLACSRPRADITEKTNLERLEDAAVMTLSSASAPQPTAEPNTAPAASLSEEGPATPVPLPVSDQGPDCNGLKSF